MNRAIQTDDPRPSACDDADDGLSIYDAGAEPSHFTMLPNVVLTLGLSPYALTLYIHLKKVTGDKGVCFKKTATLVAELKMSAGSITAAKKELATPQPLLRDKPLIIITERKKRGGGKPLHHITLTNIWAENRAAFATPETISRDEEARSYDEIASSSGEPAISSGEIKKIPPEENHGKNTHTRLRAVGAPAAEGVCVNENQFPKKTFERYARNQPAIRDPAVWANVHHKSGEWDDVVARWCAEHAIDPRTGEAVGSPGEATALAAPAPNEVRTCAACCNSSGMVPGDPANPQKGWRRCRHEQAGGVGSP